ncbi:MAG: transcriptional regulator [Acidimicrobiaceae bacterium]|nr:transcriptional regulator [Acidimicrobiaceae bacterium]
MRHMGEAPAGSGADQSGVLPTRTLVLSAIGADGTLDAGPLFAVAGVAGHSDKAMRDCLARVVRDGLLTRVSGRGRSAQYVATGLGKAELDADIGWTALAHRVDAGLEPWDGCWHLIGFEIPERRRGARDALRSLLVELGAAPVQAGLYVHSDDLTDFVRQLASHLGVSEAITSFVTRSLRVGNEQRQTDIVNRLWPLASLADRYDAVEQRLVSIAEQAPFTDGDRLATSMFCAIVDTEAVLRNDPLLAAELLPDDWAGMRARGAFMVAHSAVSAHSELFANSRLMQSFTAEIHRSLQETSTAFWTRWFPRLMDVYKAKLPPAATA